MLKPKGVNLDKAFTVHGVKEAGGDTYVLLIDFAGLTIIKKIKSDNSEIFYAKKPDGVSIPDFWSDPTLHSYTYIHLI